MSYELKLDCGVTIVLAAINQFATYEGLLEGVPTQRMNKSAIKNAMALAERIWTSPPHLIQPEETPIELGREYPFCVPASIPAITCLGRWRCPNQERGDQFGWAELCLVWYQPEFALPIDQSVEGQIRDLDWHSLSTFYEY